MSLKETEGKLLAQVHAWVAIEVLAKAAQAQLAKGEVEKADQQIDRLAAWLDHLVKARLT